MQPSSPPQTHASFTLTRRALDFMRRMVRMSGLGPRAGFRLAVEPGSCAGVAEMCSIETAPGEDDEVMDFGRVVLFVPSACRSLLDGMTVDFLDTPTHQGLAFIDPRVEACGS